MTDWDNTKYKKEDFSAISWETYGQVIDELSQKIEKYLKENNVKLNAVVPILRGGGVVGVSLAYKLRVLKVLPVQYKYFYNGSKTEVKKIGGVCEDDFKKLADSTILVVENNRCFGDTSKKAIADLKALVPSVRILYAAAFNDYSFQDMPGAEACFWGRLTNESRELTKEQSEEKGISNDMSLFPWENLEEEWNSVQLKGFQYQDEKS